MSATYTLRVQKRDMLACVSCFLGVITAPLSVRVHYALYKVTIQNQLFPPRAHGARKHVQITDSVSCYT